MGVTTARPEWTRISPGIPVDTVVRLHGGSQGDQDETSKGCHQAFADVLRCSMSHAARASTCHMPDAAAVLALASVQVLARTYRRAGGV
jgi:hypothetical protein